MDDSMIEQTVVWRKAMWMVAYKLLSPNVISTDSLLPPSNL